ncbi:hypothetical protein NUSPORA_00124 [Nucleospora cyclopteri]
MQRLSKRLKQQKNDLDITDSQKKVSKISYDIIFLMSKYEKRIRQFIKYHEKTTSVEYTDILFSSNCLPNLNLPSSIIIKNAALLLLFQLKNSKFENLHIDNVKKIDCTNITHLNVKCLTLSHMKITKGNLNSVLNITKPFKLCLQELEIEDHSANFCELINTIKKYVKNLSVNNTFITKNLFCSIIREMNSFSFVGNKEEFFYQDLYASDLKTCSFNCKIKENLIKFEEIEKSILIGNEAVQYLDKFDNLTVLSLNDCRIMTNYIININQTLIKLYIINCTFETSFVLYNLIRNNGKTLKYIEIQDCYNVPLDILQFISSNVTNCLIKIGKRPAYYVE